jgi:hypothetical protein
MSSWYSTDLASLHDHARVARQTGNNSNVLRISADDPIADVARASAMQRNRPARRYQAQRTVPVPA